MEELISVTELSKHFGPLTAVDGISFKLNRGEVLGFLGPNGSGKSTTMKMITGFLPPSAGKIEVCGLDVVEQPVEIKRRIGYLPEGAPLYSDMTPRSLLKFVAEVRAINLTERRRRIEEVSDKLQIGDVFHQPIETLSKGYKRRVGLAQAILHDPDVLILDEPAAGLDPRARVELRELIRLLASKLQKTVLISSHILTELGEICDSVVIIEAGRILASGSIDELQRGGGLQARDDADESVAESAEIVITVLERAEELERWLVQQPFVEQVSLSGPRATVLFSGEDNDRHELLKGLIESGAQVISFETKTQTLEDTFMRITRGEIQ